MNRILDNIICIPWDVMINTRIWKPVLRARLNLRSFLISIATQRSVDQLVDMVVFDAESGTAHETSRQCGDPCRFNITNSQDLSY